MIIGMSGRTDEWGGSTFPCTPSSSWKRRRQPRQRQTTKIMMTPLKWCGEDSESFQVTSTVAGTQKSRHDRRQQYCVRAKTKATPGRWLTINVGWPSWLFSLLLMVLLCGQESAGRFITRAAIMNHSARATGFIVTPNNRCDPELTEPQVGGNAKSFLFPFPFTAAIEDNQIRC